MRYQSDWCCLYNITLKILLFIAYYKISSYFARIYIYFISLGMNIFKLPALQYLTAQTKPSRERPLTEFMKDAAHRTGDRSLQEGWKPVKGLYAVLLCHQQSSCKYRWPNNTAQEASAEWGVVRTHILTLVFLQQPAGRIVPGQNQRHIVVPVRHPAERREDRRF